MSTQSYTVSQVSRMARVTVRTLHHYDEIGLLSPATRSPSGYRLYTAADLQRLHQILVLRELGFALDAIGLLIEEPPAERRAALLEQRAKLRRAQQRTEAVLRAIDTAIHAIDGAENMDTNRIFDGLDTFDHAQYAEEARERWGDTDAYRESERRTRQYSKEDWVRIKAEGEAITQEMAQLLADGRSPEEPAAMAVAERHRQHISRWYYECAPEVHVALGEMYVADPRFTATYERYRTGLAQFMRAAIVANAGR